VSVRAAVAEFRHLLVAATGGGFQPLAVNDGDAAAAVVDQLPACQHPGCGGDATAAHAEDIGQHGVGEIKTVGVGTVVGEQQPLGQPCFQHMEAGTGRGLRQLGDEPVHVAVEPLTQGGMLGQHAAKMRALHAPGTAGTLYLGAQRGRDCAQYQRQAEHAFIADQRHLERGAAGDGRHQGDETAGGKIHIADAVAGFGENFAKAQFTQLAFMVDAQPCSGW
jgi:hypothetical protein